MGENSRAHDSPVPPADSSHQSFASPSFPQSTRSLYIATGCLRFSSGPVHHPLSLALSDAWLAKRCICGGFMNKSVAINFDFNQKAMQTLNMASLQCAVITSISKVPSFQRAAINFFALEALDHTSRPWLSKEKSRQTNCEMKTFCKPTCYSNWFLLLKSSRMTGMEPERRSHLCPHVKRTE